MSDSAMVILLNDGEDGAELHVAPGAYIEVRRDGHRVRVLNVMEEEFVRATIAATRRACAEEAASAGDWQCKDYGDGWITFPDRAAAEKYQRDTGAMMRYRRLYPADSVHSQGAEPHDCTWCKTRHTGYSIQDCPEVKP